MATAEEVPVVQILDKQNYFKQFLVPLPNALPLTPLGESSLRIRTTVMSLSLNNFTYAKLGSILGWWDVHPLPASAPAPYNNASVYGRTNCWGYAKVVDSTFPGVPGSSYLFGYLPLGTLPVDMEVKAGNVPDQVFCTSAYRQHIMPTYNRYFVLPAESLDTRIEHDISSVALEVVVRLMHLTAHMMNQHVWSPDPTQTIYPGVDPLGEASWNPGKADLTDATVVVFAPGSKVGVAFAHLLRYQRGDGPAKPRLIVGVASEFSKSFVEKTGLYDGVFLTSDDAVSVLQKLDADPKSKIAIFDFGGRAGAATKWAEAVKPAFPNVQHIVVGSEVVDPSTTSGPPLRTAAGTGETQPLQINADDMRRRAIAKVGEREFFDGDRRSLERLLDKGVKGLSVKVGYGMEDVKKAWDALAAGNFKPNEALAFKL